MKIGTKTICKWCGKEFEQRGGRGKPSAYCSEKCRKARRNRSYRDNKVKELGMDYWAWKWRNDPAFRERKRERQRKYDRPLAERRREKEKEKEKE